MPETAQLIAVATILLVTLALFISERLRVDLVAIMVLVTLALLGLVTPAEALSGFSSPAVVTVWAVFVLSAGLQRTGVAAWIGRQVMRVGGTGEMRLILVIMVTAASLSAFMNNVGVAAMLLPVVMDIARRTGHTPGRLLMPLAYGSLLGGLNTLIGTPPNILVGEAMTDAGLQGFSMFDFAAVGLPLTVVGVLYMVFAGRYLLPRRDMQSASISTGSDEQDVDAAYDLHERLFSLRVPEGSPLAGLRLDQVRLGSALGYSVVAVTRGRRIAARAPDSDYRLREGDSLTVVGRPDRLDELKAWRDVGAGIDRPNVGALIGAGIGLAEARLAPGSPLVGQTLRQAAFRGRHGISVLAVRDGWLGEAVRQPDRRSLRRTDLQDVTLRAGNYLLLYGPLQHLTTLRDSAELEAFEPLASDLADTRYRLSERLAELRVREASSLDGVTLAESRLGASFDLVVLAIVRGADTLPSPNPSTPLRAHDHLIVEGHPSDLALVAGLQGLDPDAMPPPDLRDLVDEEVGLAEVILSPHSAVEGSTLRALRFREKYGLSVLAVWRRGRARRSDLADLPLQFGDAFLVFGRREQLSLLGAEPDFVVLTESAQDAPRVSKALPAALIMAGMLTAAVFGGVPIAIAAMAGAALMVLVGCLTMDEAYRAIEWKAVFLIAGLLPLGIAMERTGAARIAAEWMVEILAPQGQIALISGVFLLTNLATQIMPNPAVAVLMAPIALGAASDLGLSPHALAMVIAMGASAAVMSPVGHPANVLVMGPGGYRFSDYVKVGLPLTLIMLVVLLLTLPFAWPL